MRPSKGVHILFPLGAFPSEGLRCSVPKTEDGRLIFAVPVAGPAAGGHRGRGSHAADTDDCASRGSGVLFCGNSILILSEPLQTKQIVRRAFGAAAAGSGGKWA